MIQGYLYIAQERNIKVLQVFHKSKILEKKKQKDQTSWVSLGNGSRIQLERLQVNAKNTITK